MNLKEVGRQDGKRVRKERGDRGGGWKEEEVKTGATKGVEKEKKRE